MGRPSVYTPEQDAIILSTSNNAEVNRRFEERGYATKSASAITARRNYLRSGGAGLSVQSDPEERYALLLQTRRELQVERKRLETQLAACNERIRSVNLELRRAAEEAERLLEEEAS